ncbi:MAG: copper transport protein [Pseudonocardiales bacterium]|nr:copper transport protein [Pseudonocardiales bacterium]
MGGVMDGVVVHRRIRAALVLLLGVAGLMLLGAPSANAHAVLSSTTPTSGQVLPTGRDLDRVELRFDEPVEAALGSLQVVGADGHRVDTATVRHPGGAGARVEVGLRPRLPDGSYLVVWRVVSADSHPVHGSFTFSVGRPGPLAQRAAGHTAASLGLALGVARFVGYAGLLLLIGVVAFLVLCLPTGWSDPGARRLLWFATVLAAAGTASGLCLQAAYDVGGGWTRAVDPATVGALLDTRLGHAHLVRLAALAGLWVVLLRYVRRPRPMILALVVGALLVCIGSVTIEGHNGVSPAWITVGMVHFAAAGTWLGGLAVLATVVIPSCRRAARQPAPIPGPGPSSGIHPVPGGGPDQGTIAVLERPTAQALPWVPVRRFSVVALTCVGTLAATGVLQAVRQVPELAELKATRYGQLLLIKIAVVLLVVAGAAVSRAALNRRRLSEEVRAVALTRSVALEAALAIIVLVVTSALVATTPARAAYRPVQERTLHAGPDSIQLTAVSSGPRTLDVHLYAFGSDGLPTEVTSIEVSARPSGGGLGSVSLRLLQAGTGHFLADHVLLPHTGTWLLTLRVRTSEFDSYPATTSLTIR